MTTAIRARLGRSRSIGLVGLEGHRVDIETHLAQGLPAFTIVGLPDASLSEARDRVRAAITCTGLALPQKRITVNLAPASLPKRGSGFDLGIAIAVLAAAGIVDASLAARAFCLGELGLDGRVHAIRGVLPAVAAAVKERAAMILVPHANAAEARLVPDANVQAVRSLAHAAAILGAEVAVPQARPEPPSAGDASPSPPRLDMADVVGQYEARQAIEIAAAGGHHLLMVGSPGSGKTMLAQRMPSILPPLSDEHAVEVTAIHSLAGTLDPSAGLIRRPPFESPHHTATAASIVGGGSGLPRPGAISLAHRGILFLDEVPEFGARVLQTLRQPIEAGELTIHRSGGIARYPARFQLVMAANPCPCGRALERCECTSLMQRRYFSRLSGPLLDRVDLHTNLVAHGVGDMYQEPGETSAIVAQRVAAARSAAEDRLEGTPWRSNAEVPGTWLRQQWGPDRSLIEPIHAAVRTGALSMRAADRVARVAWTIGDLGGRVSPSRADILTALSLRSTGPAR